MQLLLETKGEGIGVLGLRVTVSCEPLVMGAGN